MVFISWYLLEYSAYCRYCNCRNCKKLREFEEIEISRQTRVGTKISRNEIPRYFVLFLFRIFAKIFGKFRGISFRENVLIFVIFRGIPFIWIKLSERKLVPVFTIKM